MYYYQKLKSLLLLLLVAVTAKAQLSDGKVYNFVNVGKGTSMSITANDVIVTLPDVRKYSQLWYAASEGNGFTLRNLANGHYLKSPNAQSGAWSTVKEKDANCIFAATSVGSNYALRATNSSGNYHYMHADGGNTIVCWESSNENSQWTMNIVDIDDATLNANWNELASIDPSTATVATYQTHLDNLFSDKACTTLKKLFANENAVKNDADYMALPTTLQQMVLKVYKDSWAENNYDANKSDWDADYAKKYRVQLYEPYNEPEAAASALGLNAHTNLNNPTGIFANDREALYVMVGGEIETGASLYLVSYTGNGELAGYNDGYELKQGLNIIPSFSDGNNYCINYVVHTFDTSKGKGNKAKSYRLSDFEDLKIHIEGGYINGYYNKMGDELYGSSGDKAANWDYIEARATQTTVTILGEYITLQFPLNDAVDSDGVTQKGMSYYLDIVSVEDVIDEWDKVMLWERLVLGVLDEETTKAEAKKSPYSDKDYVFEYTGTDNDGFESGYGDYYNVHGLSLGIPNSYMYGGWRFCGYNYGTMNDIMVNILTNAGAHWGPGHEIGHQHQNLLTVNGLTEVTNNLFANVVLWYFGETTSRVNGSEGALSNVLAAFNTEGSDFFTNNIWALTHMYYKLFLYYHVLGHNTKFYPTLFEMLRQDSMSEGYNQSGATTLLHFYKKCCLASGDDLTEFFRAYGFFSVMDNRLVGDYNNSVYTTTQADIDAAIKEVKTLGYDENIAVLFINDATGETIKSHKGDDLEKYGETTICAEVGSYASFTANTTPDYTYTVSGNTVTMEGEGGTGFAIFNEKGELIAFSDKKTFEISNECAAAIASGKAEIRTVKADNTTVEATDVMDTDNTAAKYAALGGLLDIVKVVTDLVDDTGKKVGYYRTEQLTDLQAAYETAKTVYDNETVASYTAVYDVLYQEYANVVDDDFARIGIIEGNAYRLTNGAYPGRSMAVNTSNNQMSGVATADTDEQKWYFEASNSLGRYYLKNKSTGKYPGDTSSGAVLSANKDDKSDNGAYAYELRSMGNGLWALVGSTGIHCSASQSYNIVGWGADAEASQWYITAVEIDQNAETLYELQTLIAKTEALVDEMATVQGKGTAVELSEENVSSNTPESGHEAKYLVDGNPSTFFHTNWTGTGVSEYHNIVIDLGEQHSLAEFVLNYMTLPTSAYNVDAPKSMIVSGSNDGSSYSTITTLSGLPTDKGAEYTSNTLGNASQAYRYIRLQVTDATGGSLGGYKYFGLAELNLTRMSTLVETIDDKYANFISAAEVATVCDTIYAAQQACASGAVTSADIDALQEQYNILLAAYENANNVEFNAKKQELLDLISSTNSLINSCGTVTLGENRTLTLSTSSGVGDARLTQWSSGSSEGSLANLYDGNVGTYYVSNWNAVNAAPYLQVYFNDGVGVDKFIFTFTGRKDGNAPTPTTIVVSGSNNGSTFTEIETFTKDGTWPVAANNQTITPRTWTSPTITTTTAYKYLRFTVTAAERSSGNVNNYYGYCHYGISEFGVNRVVETSIELSDEHGEATEELLLTTYQAVQTAQDACNRATTETQLQNAITTLQGQYDALYTAMNPSVEYTISTNVTGGGVTFDGGEPCVGGGTLTVPTSLTLDELKAKLAAIELSGYVAQSITINENLITVIYNKVYTVEVIGAEGGVSYNGGAEVKHNETIIVPQNIDETLLKASTVTGYNAAVEVNHENGTICVTYTLDRTELENLIGETNELMQACQVFVNSAYVTEQLLTNTSTAITAAMEIFSKEDLTYAEYTAAVSALQTAYGTLNTAKGNAENEVTARNQLKEQLIALIGETETLIASCYENDELKYVNSDYVTEISIAEIRSAIETAQAKCNSNGTTESEYNASLGTLGQMKDDLATAIENANNEAATRDGKRAELNALIDAANELITLCGTAPGDATESLINEVSATVTSAQEVASNMGSSVEALTTATDALQAKYDVLNAAQQSTAKTDLRALIDLTTELIAQCGTVEYVTTTASVDLQTGDANADFWLSTNAQESSEGDIANLLQDDDFFHSSWSSKVGTDEVAVAHYLQVDMGANHALKEFAFSYTTRNNGNGGPHPSTIVVSGSNSTDDASFVTLTTFDEGLPTTGNTSWNATGEQIVTASEAYRYLRFTVTASAGDNGCQHGNGEYYFAMSKFSLTSISHGYTVELLNSNVTEEQLIAIYQANDAAATLAHNSAVQADLLAEKTRLQTLYDALLDAATSVKLPVTLTTDANAPVLYTIKTKRSGNPVLQYDETTEMFSVTTAVASQATQAFYFMKGAKVDGTQQVYIYPYMAGGKVLAANDVIDGKEKALAMDKGTATYEQWVFVERADGYYNLQPAGTTTYLSNIYGTSSKMGFYSSSPDSDEGSLFKFEATIVEGSYYYLKLKDYYENRTKVASSDIQGGAGVGCYPADQAAAYNTAYAAATEALSNVNTDDVYQTAYNDLVAANEALELTMPSADKYYRFVSVVKNDGNSNYAYVYANPADNKMYWATGKENSDATAIWKITPSATEGQYNISNFHTGSNINGFIYYDPSPLSETVGDISIVSLSANDGQIGFKCNGTMMHAQGDGAIVHWTTGANDGSAWRIVEVTNEELSLVEFALTIGQYRHAGLYLNYATKIPQGVKVYMAHTSDEEEGVVIADELDGTILPARTAVIVKGAPDTYKFKRTIAGYDGTDDLEANLLGGSAYLKYQQVEETGNRCCVFGRSAEGEVGLYKNYVQYVDANGSTTIKETVDGEERVIADYTKTDDGTHFKISANKIYYEYTPSTVAGASAFRFRFNNKQEGTTIIDELVIADDDVIYNLYGQRLTEVVEPGIYIINGKKVYVTEKMITNK